VRATNDFRVTKDRKVSLGDVEIPGCIGFDVHIEAGKDPEVVLRVSCGSVSIDDYTDVWTRACLKNKSCTKHERAVL